MEDISFRVKEFKYTPPYVDLFPGDLVRTLEHVLH